MKALKYFSLLLLAGVNACAQPPVPKSRANSFFGVHFDFHATENDANIGGTLTPQMINLLLTQVKPDYIQVDTKGHPGIASYPTKVGVAAKGLVNDPLKIFRQATAAKGVALYSHFSGVLDYQAVKDHPDWARINANGQRDNGATSIFGAYCDSYFIPQIEELSKNYGINGVWVDGECWSVQPDFSAKAKAAYTSATGKPAVMNDDYMEFTRRAFHKYLAHYTAVLHQYNPHLQIASNWAFSSYMPGRVDAGVDFLSGDVVNDNTKLMEFEPRVMADEGKPWDLMIWAFMGDKNGQGQYYKSARMLEQKAALIISQGGGCLMYYPQNRDASIPAKAIPVLKQVAQFCYARKPYCFKNVGVPQVAMLFSGSGHDHDLGTSVAFNQNNGGNDNIKGTMAMLLNSQYSVQVLQEFDLTAKLSRFPLLVVTEWNYLDPATIQHIETYVSNGGKVLVIGGTSCNLFSKMLGQSSANTNNPAGLQVKKQAYGKGMIEGIPANISLNYLNSPDDKIRATIAGAVRDLFPDPIVSVTAANNIHVTVNRKGKSSYIQLINTSDNMKVLSNNQLEYEMEPVRSVNVTYRQSVKPAHVLLQPGNVPVNYTYANGKVQFAIPQVDIYSIVEIN